MKQTILTLTAITALTLATFATGPARAAGVANLWLNLPDATDVAGQIRAALSLDEQCSRDLGGILDKASIEVINQWGVPTYMLGKCVMPGSRPLPTITP